MCSVALSFYDVSIETARFERTPSMMSDLDHLVMNFISSTGLQGKAQSTQLYVGNTFSPSNNCSRVSLSLTI